MQAILRKIANGESKKGDYRYTRASNSPFTGKEPDIYVKVDIPNLPVTDFMQYEARWDRIIDYEVVNSNPVIDGFRIRLYSPLFDSSGNGKITLAEVENFITNWGGTIYSYDDNEVIFDILILDALKSIAFWDINITGIIFTETDYDQGTGIHTIEADYNAIGNSPDYVEKYVIQKGGTILTHQDKIIIYEMNRIDAKTEFQSDIQNKARKLIYPRRYRVNDAIIDYIIGQGGSIEIDEATLLSYIKDKVDD